MWKTPLNDTTKLTVELRELVENGIDPWDFDYPSYYEGAEKTEFEQRLLAHYWFRQIGQETPARWLHYFRVRVREIMPYYIARWKSVKLMEEVGDPFQAYDLTETYTEERTGSATGSSSSNVAHNDTENTEFENASTSDTSLTSRTSNTPHGRVENLDDGFLTSANKDDTNVEGSSSGTTSRTAGGSSTVEGSSSSDNNERVTHTLTRKGNIGVQPLGQEINAYRSALINVDLEFINEFNDLFLMVY